MQQEVTQLDSRLAQQTVSAFGLDFFSGSRSDVAERILASLSSPRKPLIIFTPNPEQIVQAMEEPHFFSVLNQADILLPDGIGLVWATQFLAFLGRSKRLSRRISGIDVVTDLLKKVPQTEDILLLGGKGLSTTSTVRVLDRNIFWLAGYQDVAHPLPLEEKNVLDTIKNICPKILLVAFGAPYQETWVIDHQRQLVELGVQVTMVVGGSFDVLTGRLKRAPRFWQLLGMEWLFRLLQEPRRWRRQLRLLTFIGLVLRNSTH